MPRLTFWKDRKSNNYKFFDKTIKKAFDIGGTPVYVHKYLGPIDPENVKAKSRIKHVTNDIPDVLLSEGFSLSDNSPLRELQIQDLIYLENRNRQYDENVYELRGVYTPTDIDFDLRQFGLFLGNDQILIYFHYNDMIERLGRPIIPGDVLELPHLRMNHLDPNKPPINKFYVVEDVSRDPDSYSWTWHFHIWRARGIQMQDQQEYESILQKMAEDAYGAEYEEGYTVRDIASTREIDEKITERLNELAQEEVKYRKFNHSHLYIMPHYDEEGNLSFPDTFNRPPILAYGDGEPPNGAVLVGKGTRFPENPNEGDYFLRTDYQPELLFRYEKGIWRRVEFNWRTEWSPARDSLKEFINQEGELQYQNTGEKMTKRQYVSKVLNPKKDRNQK